MFGEMKELSLKMINASSPYDVMMVDSNTYRVRNRLWRRDSY